VAAVTRPRRWKSSRAIGIVWRVCDLLYACPLPGRRRRAVTPDQPVDEMPVLAYGSGIGPPALPSGMSLLAALGSAGVLVAFHAPGQLPAHWTGWALGELCTVVFLVIHRLVDRRRSRRPDYAAARYIGGFVAWTAVAGTGVGLAHVWY